MERVIGFLACDGLEGFRIRSIVSVPTWTDSGFKKRRCGTSGESCSHRFL